ncbi:MAG: hypothetical protein HY776_08095 [Actinobacteria bacterium]|nr:hypothetical protein [Actinomycetota bacterium]
MIEKERLKELISKASLKKNGFADIFVEDKTATILKFDNGRMEKATYGKSKGAGVRIISDGSEGYACVDGFNEQDIMEAIKIAGNISGKNLASKEVVVNKRCR